MELTQIVLYPFLFIALFFEVFLVLTYIDGLKNKAQKKPAYKPSVTIIVPCYNEQSGVVQTIQSLLALTYPASKLSIIAVDDGSTDNTWNVLQQFKDHPRVQLLQKENGGKHTAMNYALQYVRTEIVGCLDADSYVDSRALLYSVQHFKNPAVASVTPNIRVHTPATVIQRIQQAEYSLSAFVRRTFGLLDAIIITPGPFSLFRMKAIERVGAWRAAHSTEDYEIALRLRTHRLKIVNEHNALVYTKTPPTLFRLFRQRVRWMYGFFMNTYDYRHFLFSTQTGNVGVFVLPIALVSVFGALYMFVYSLITLAQHTIDTFVRIHTAGISFSLSADLFFVSATAMVFIALILMALTAVLITLGRDLSNEQRFSINTLLYLALFGFIAPLWLAAAAIKALRGSGARWR